MNTFYCHRDIDAVTCVCVCVFVCVCVCVCVCMCVCGYFGTNHACSKIINGKISISPCPDECPVCQDAIDKCEYFDLRCQKNDDGYTACGVCNEKLECRAKLFQQ